MEFAPPLRQTFCYHETHRYSISRYRPAVGAFALSQSSKESRDKHDQRERFEQAARELGVDLDEAKLKETLRKIAPDPKKSERAKSEPGKQHRR